jgi:hypothetical protein
MRIRTIVISGFAFLAAAGTSLAATLTTGLVDVTAIADTEGETRLLCRIDDLAAVADTRHIAVDRAILHFSLAGEAAEQRLAVQMHPITRGWNAGSVDWTTGWIRAGGDFDDDVYGRAYVHFDRATSEVSVDITVPVREALLHDGIVTKEHIVANSFSGVSGAGKKLEETFLFVERAESAKAYGLVKHRHIAEIEEQLSLQAGSPIVLQFNPHLAPMRRGIATTITVPAKEASIDALYASWRAAYGKSPFVQLLLSGDTPDTAHVIGTNRIDMSAVLDPRTGNFVITSAEDNLVKGASGQAVQIMNLWCGFDETAGLV